MESQSFDIVIIGGGPGGYVCAIRAAQAGLSVALVERENLGGVCLNWGCIPTKSLLYTADLFREIQEAETFGISVQKATFDLEKVVQRSRAVSEQLTNGVKFLMKKNKVQIFDGIGRLDGPGRVLVTAEDQAEVIIESNAIVIATGARARSLPNIEPDGEHIWTYREAMVPKELPKKLLVIGSGAIGIEFASFYNALGSDVTIVEVLPQILPVEDTEVSEFVQKEFEGRGVKIMTATRVESLNLTKKGLSAKITSESGSEENIFDRAILAVGVTGNIENLGIETTSVTTEKGSILVNEWLETEEEGIYAIGDVAGAPLLAHKAMHEGVFCAEQIAGINHAQPMQKSRVPGCTYCHPQVASVGLTERAASEAGYKLRIGKFPLMGNGKAIAIGDTAGFVKTIFDADTDELIGAHLVGPAVTEMIQGFVVAMGLETTETELMEAIFPHPTVSEAMHESILDAYGQALHI